VGDQQAMQTRARDAAAQLAYAAVVVHRERINQGSGIRFQRSGTKKAKPGFWRVKPDR
jgi:hypothetical protein